MPGVLCWAAIHFSKDSHQIFLSSDINWANRSEWRSQREFTEFLTWLNMQQTVARSYFLNFLRNIKANALPFNNLTASWFPFLIESPKCSIVSGRPFSYQPKIQERRTWKVSLRAPSPVLPLSLSNNALLEKINTWIIYFKSIICMFVIYNIML